TYYLSTAGNDANSCTAAQNASTPKATMNSILNNCIAAGDTVYIRGGTYNQRMDFMTHDKNGAAGNPITIAGYPGETVIWKYADPIVADYGGIKAWGRSYLTFKDFTVDGSLYTFTAGVPTSGTGWHIRGGHDIILDNMNIIGQPSSGVHIGGGAGSIP